jgi:hypothetical protein
MHETERFGRDLSRFMRGVEMGGVPLPEEGGGERDPSLARATGGDPRLFFIRDAESGDAVCYEWDRASDEETLVVRNERMLPEGFPFTTRLHLDRRGLRPLAPVVVDESEAATSYALRHEPNQRTADQLRFEARSYPGPREKDQTYSGTFVDRESETEYEVFSVVDPNVVVVIILAGAALCAGLIAVGAIKKDCAESCVQACGGGDSVASCEADIDAGIVWEEGSWGIECSYECNTECKGGDGGGNGGGDSSWWPPWA